MKAPVAPWVFQVVGPIVWLILAVVFARRVWREREVPFPAIVFIAATTMWWQEWYGDWGSYLLYNPRFELIPWGPTKWTTPNKPWAVIAAYGWFYTAAFSGMLWLIGRVRAARPRWGRLATLLVVVVPTFYLWDVVVEAAAASLAWWSYTDPLGPAIRTSRGNLPLVFPLLLFVLYGVVATRMMDWRDDLGRFRHEVLLRAHRVRAGWPRELARVGAWVLAMNVLYWVLLEFPLVLLREAFGDPSALVP